jgi:glycosyltransferase involved in cell wall biosynthesis
MLQKELPEYQILLISPSLIGKGGVADFCKLLIQNIQINFKIDSIEVGNRPGNRFFLKRILYFFQDNWRLLITLMKNEYHVVHLNPSFKKLSLLRDSFYFILIKKIFRKNVLMMFHGWDENLARTIPSKSFLRKSFKGIYKNADFLIVLSHSFKKCLTEIGLSPERVGVLTTMYPKMETSFPDQIRTINAEKINLLFLSRFIESKGVYIAAQVAKLLVENGFKNFKLLFAGDGPESKGLEDFIQKNQLEDYVELKGFVTGEKKREILQSSRIFLFPTFYGEGCPVAVLEAMGAGLAIVSTPVGAIPEIVDHNQNGFIVNSKDPKDFFRAVQELIEDRDRLQRMQRLNRQKAEENYEAKIVTQKVESIYLSILHA